MNEGNNLNNVQPNLNPQPNVVPNPVNPLDQKVAQMEQEMMKENLVPPAEPVKAPVEPTIAQQPVQQTAQSVQQVEPQIDPSFGTNVAIPVQQVPAPTKKKSKLPIVLIVLVILAIGGFACWKFVLPMLNKTNNTNEQTTETTTTTTVESKLLKFSTIEEYSKLVKDNNFNGETGHALLLDDSFYDIQYNLSERCQNDGDLVTYTIRNSQVEYTCQSDPNLEPEWGTKEWIADVKVNGKYNKHKTTMTTCLSWAEYTNGKYYINTEHVCVAGTQKVTIETENNEKLYDGNYSTFYFTSDPNSDENAYNNYTPIIIKDNIVYFVAADTYDESTTSTCRIKYIDFNEENPSIKNMNVEGTCYNNEIA